MSDASAPKQLSKRTLLVLLIGASLLYFPVGGLCIWFGILATDSYALIGGLVGSIASILGLISLSRPALTQTDLDQIELESLRKVADTTEELKRIESERVQEIQRLEDTRALTAEQIEQLKQQKQEMEFLVIKGSMILLLQDQRKRRLDQVLAEVEKSPALKSLMDELQSIEDKLYALNQEVEANPHVELLRSVIKALQRKDDEVADFIDALPPFTGMLVKTSVEISRRAARFIRNRARN